MISSPTVSGDVTDLPELATFKDKSAAGPIATVVYGI